MHCWNHATPHPAAALRANCSRAAARGKAGTLPAGGGDFHSRSSRLPDVWAGWISGKSGVSSLSLEETIVVRCISGSPTLKSAHCIPVSFRGMIYRGDGTRPGVTHRRNPHAKQRVNLRITDFPVVAGMTIGLFVERKYRFLRFTRRVEVVLFLNASNGLKDTRIARTTIVPLETIEATLDELSP